MKILWLVMCCLMFLVASAKGDFYDYIFTGIVPSGASSHSQVADGESWTAIMRIDATVIDSNPDPNFGEFDGAVVSGTLQFSGGYVPANVDFAGGSVRVLNDVFGADSVRVRGQFGLTRFLFQANSEDLSTLSSDQLVGPGTTITAFPNPASFEYFQLVFDDEFGSIFYFADVDHNVNLVVRAIPEPSSGLMAGLVLSAWIVRRRRS